MPRFVVLTHDHPFLHWDLMLEQGSALRTWRLMQSPAVGVEIAAEILPDHRLRYLDYEGPVGGGRGEVRRWDGGEYETLDESQNGLILHLNGQRLRGRAHLQSSPGEGRWTFRIETPN